MPTLKDNLKRNVVLVNPDDSVKKAISLISSKNIGCVISVENNKPVGILTERDLIRKILSKGLDSTKVTVKDIMTKNIISLESERSIQEAVHLLEKRHIKKLPIIDNGKLIGIVTITDLLSSMRRLEYDESEKLKKTIKNLHLTKIKLQSRIIELEENLAKKD